MSILNGIEPSDKASMDLTITIGKSELKIEDFRFGQLKKIRTTLSNAVTLTFRLYGSADGSKSLLTTVKFDAGEGRGRVQLESKEDGLNIETNRYLDLDLESHEYTLDMLGLLPAAGFFYDDDSNAWAYSPFSGLTEEEEAFCRKIIDEYKPKDLLLDTFYDASDWMVCEGAVYKESFGNVLVFTYEDTLIITGIDNRMYFTD